MRNDQVNILKVDINQELSMLQTEYLRTYQERINAQQELAAEPDVDKHRLHKEQNIWRPGPQNYIC